MEIFIKEEKKVMLKASIILAVLLILGVVVTIKGFKHNKDYLFIPGAFSSFILFITTTLSIASHFTGVI